MTVQENARFTVYHMVSENKEYLWNIAKAIQTSLKINAITSGEAEMLCNNLKITMKEMEGC